MKRFLQIASAAALLTSGAAADDGLDEALAELKQKAQRQSYSTRADLHSRQMAVPAVPTEEDEALDAKLRQMENQLDRNAAIAPGAARLPRPRRRPAAQQEDRNWLTPALLDDDALEDTGIEEEPSDWIADELGRQKAIRLEQEALKRATGAQPLFNNPLEKEIDPDSPLSDLRSYDRSLNDILAGGSRLDEEEHETTPQPGWSARRTERAESPFSLSARNREKEEEASGISPFSQQRRQTQPLFGEPQGRSGSTTQSRFSSAYTSPFKKESSSGTTAETFQPSWKKEQKPLSPVERIRNASPIHKKDPFSEDFSPDIKGSIWD